MTTAFVHDVQPAPPVGAPGAPTTAGRRIMGVLLHDRGALFSAGFIALMLLMAICAPLITALTGHGPTAFDTAAIDVDAGGLPKGDFGGISTDHLLGVEPLNGRDVLARIAYGARVSFLIAASATVLTTLLGVVLGMVAGLLRGLGRPGRLPGHGLPDGLSGTHLHDRHPVVAAHAATGRSCWSP